MEEVAFLKVEAQFKLAEQSLPSLQKDRYSAVIEFYTELVDNYPQSPFLKEAEKYYSQSITKVNQYKTNNS